MTLEWRKIEDYVAPPATMSEPIVLLGWWSPGGGGYPASVGGFSIGYRGLDGLWYDADTPQHQQRRWRLQPTHFATVNLRNIPVADGASINERSE